METRKPERDELDNLIQYLMFFGHEPQDAEDMVDEAAIMVVPEYLSDGPSWTGKAMMVIWSGEVNIFQVFKFEGTRLVEAEPNILR